jgi:hypothetical protein
LNLNVEKLSENGRLIIYEDSPFVQKFPKAIITKSPKTLVTSIENLIESDITLSPASKGIRYRHVVKENTHYYIIFNEGEEAVQTKIGVSAKGKQWWLNETNAEAREANLDEEISFQPHELKILMVK